MCGWRVAGTFRINESVSQLTHAVSLLARADIPSQDLALAVTASVNGDGSLRVASPRDRSDLRP